MKPSLRSLHEDLQNPSPKSRPDIPAVKTTQIDLNDHRLHPAEWITEPTRNAPYRAAAARRLRANCWTRADWIDATARLPRPSEQPLQLMELKLIAKRCLFALKPEKPNLVLEPDENPPSALRSGFLNTCMSRRCTSCRRQHAKVLARASVCCPRQAARNPDGWGSPPHGQSYPPAERTSPRLQQQDQSAAQNRHVWCERYLRPKSALPQSSLQ